MSEEQVSRREALTGGAATIAAVGAALAVSAVARDAHADNAADATALNGARTRAFLLIRMYDQATGYFGTMTDAAAAKLVLTHFSAQHRDAADRLATQITALGGTPIGENTVLPPSSPTGFTLSVTNYLKWASNLEKSTVLLNVATLNTIASQDAAELMAAIVGTETQHFTVLYLLVRGIVTPGAMAAAMSDQIVPRSFVSLAAAPAVSLSSLADIPFGTT